MAWHHYAPGCRHIHVTVPSPACAPPPVGVAGPTEGSFVHVNLSAAVPAAHPPLSVVPRLVFSHFSAASPRCAFSPPSTTGLGFAWAVTSPKIHIVLK